MALTNFDDDQFEELPPEGTDGGETPPEPPKPSGNKTFLVVVGLIVAVFVIALVGLVLLAPKILASQKSAYLQQAAEINAANTATSVYATQQAFAEALALTPTATLEPTLAPEPSATPVLAMPTEEPTAEPPAISEDEALAFTATVAALLTEQAGGVGGGVGTAEPTVAPAATALPNTGLMDDLGQFGLAGTLGLAALLVVIIVIARRLRLSAH